MSLHEAEARQLGCQIPRLCRRQEAAAPVVVLAQRAVLDVLLDRVVQLARRDLKLGARPLGDLHLRAAEVVP